MRTFFVPLIFFALFLIDSNAQSSAKYSGLWIEKSSIYSGKNLKDSVKAVYFKINKPKQSLSKLEINDFITYNDIRNFIYLSIDKHGRIISELGEGGFAGDTYLANVDSKKTTDYKYDEKDWLEKSKYKTSFKQYFPVLNNNLLMKLNRLRVDKNDKKVIKIGGKVWRQFNKEVYIYFYDEKGKIKEELEYVVNRTGEVLKDTIQRKEDLFSRKINTYNTKGQVTNQKIIQGLYAKEKDRSYSDLGTEVSFCNDLQLKYTYDQLGRMTQIILYGCGKTVAREEYIYHPVKDYVEKVKYYLTGAGGISYPTKNFENTYNEQGDIIQKEFIPDFPEQNLNEKVRYYSYEYDSHNNWIKCNMYLEGTKEAEPTLVAERKIDYYN